MLVEPRPTRRPHLRRLRRARHAACDCCGCMQRQCAYLSPVYLSCTSFGDNSGRSNGTIRVQLQLSLPPALVICLLLCGVRGADVLRRFSDISSPIVPYCRTSVDTVRAEQTTRWLAELKSREHDNDNRYNDTVFIIVFCITGRGQIPQR